MVFQRRLKEEWYITNVEVCRFDNWESVRSMLRYAVRRAIYRQLFNYTLCTFTVSVKMTERLRKHHIVLHIHVSGVTQLNYLQDGL